MPWNSLQLVVVEQQISDEALWNQSGQELVKSNAREEGVRSRELSVEWVRLLCGSVDGASLGLVPRWAAFALMEQFLASSWHQRSRAVSRSLLLSPIPTLLLILHLNFSHPHLRVLSLLVLTSWARLPRKLSEPTRVSPLLGPPLSLWVARWELQQCRRDRLPGFLDSGFLSELQPALRFLLKSPLGYLSDTLNSTCASKYLPSVPQTCCLWEMELFQPHQLWLG